MFESKAKKAAKFQLKVEQEKARIKAKEEFLQPAKELRKTTSMGEDLRPFINWIKSHKKISLGLTVTATLLMIPVSINSANEAARLEAEREKAALIEAEKAAERAKIEAEESARIEAERKKATIEFKETFGFNDIADFTTECKTLISSESGSSDFGYWNQDVYEYPDAGSLVLNASVYGKNAFDAKVEQRWKCWSDSTGNLETELLNVSID